MNVMISNYIASLIQIFSSPASLAHLGLAAAHLIIMHCYLRHRDGLPLALCAGLASTLYVFLAVMHGLAY